MPVADLSSQLSTALSEETILTLSAISPVVSTVDPKVDKPRIAPQVLEVPLGDIVI